MGGGGGEDTAQPALPSGPGEGAAGTRHSLPGDSGGEGRAGEENSRASGTPSWAGPLPLPPGAGEPIRPPRPLLLQDPMTQRPEQGGGGLGWLLPYRPSPLVIQASTSLSATCPSSAAPPCIIHCQEKGTETRKEGSQKGGAVLHPLTQPKPQGAWGQGKALVPSPLAP